MNEDIESALRRADEAFSRLRRNDVEGAIAFIMAHPIRRPLHAHKILQMQDDSTPLLRAIEKLEGRSPGYYTAGRARGSRRARGLASAHGTQEEATRTERQPEPARGRRRGR